GQREGARHASASGAPLTERDPGVIGDAGGHLFGLPVLLHDPLPFPPVGKLLFHERLVGLRQEPGSRSVHGGHDSDDDLGAHGYQRSSFVVKTDAVRSPGKTTSDQSATRSWRSIELFSMTITAMPALRSNSSDSSAVGGREVTRSTTRSSSMPTVWSWFCVPPGHGSLASSSRAGLLVIRSIGM